MSERTIDTDPDAELVAGMRRGDETAYQELVRRYTPIMLGVARARVGRQAVAEDVVQDTWLAVVRHIGAFRGQASFKTWLMRILVNTAGNHASRERRAVCWPATADEIHRWEDALRASSPAEPDDPERDVLSDMAWEVIRDAIGTLPDRQRTVLVLRDVHGMSSEEVCTRLRVSAGNQRILLHRGRARMRRMLAPVTAGRAAGPG